MPRQTLLFFEIQPKATVKVELHGVSVDILTEGVCCVHSLEG